MVVIKPQVTSVIPRQRLLRKDVGWKGGSVVDNEDWNLGGHQITKSRGVAITVLLPQEARRKIDSLYDFETSKMRGSAPARAGS